MVDPDVIVTTLAELADRIDRIRIHAGASAAELAADRDALDIVSFNLGYGRTRRSQCLRP